MDKEEKLMAEVLAEAGVSGSPVIRKQKCTECGTIFETDDGRIKRCPACRDKEKVVKEVAEKVKNPTKFPEIPPEDKVYSGRASKPTEADWQCLCKRQSEEINKLFIEVDTLTNENKRLKGGMSCLIEALNHLYGRN